MTDEKIANHAKNKLDVFTIKVTKGNVHSIRSREDNSNEEIYILVSHYKRIYPIYGHGYKRKRMHVINSSSVLHIKKMGMLLILKGRR